MDRDTFVQPENWWGSYYELAIVYAPLRQDLQVLRALETLWRSPALVGPWMERSRFQKPVEIPCGLDAEGSNQLYGVFDLSATKSVGCTTLTVREENGHDWLDFCVPTGMLDLIYPVAYPLLRKTNPWLNDVDAILVQIANAVYEEAPYAFGIIGEEVSGQVDEQDLATRRLENSGLLIPPDTFAQLAPNETGVVLQSGLHWFPQTEDRSGK